MLLQVVADTGDVRGDLDLAGQLHAGDLAQRRVRLLGRRGVHTRAHAAALGLPFSAGVLVLLVFAWRPLRTSCWIVGTGSLRSLLLLSARPPRTSWPWPRCGPNCCGRHARMSACVHPRGRRVVRLTGPAARFLDSESVVYRALRLPDFGQAPPLGARTRGPGKPGHEGKEYRAWAPQVKTGWPHGRRMHSSLTLDTGTGVPRQQATPLPVYPLPAACTRSAR